jgi:hypothetical protein
MSGGAEEIPMSFFGGIFRDPVQGIKPIQMVIISDVSIEAHIGGTIRGPFVPHLDTIY